MQNIQSPNIFALLQNKGYIGQTVQKLETCVIVQNVSIVQLYNSVLVSILCDVTSYG